MKSYVKLVKYCDAKMGGIIIKYFKHLIVSFLIALVPLIINISNAYQSKDLGKENIISTALFIVAWVLYGFYCGNRKSEGFVLFIFTSWSANIVIIIIHHLINISFLYVFPVFTSLIPMYGLYYFINSTNMNAPLSYCILILPILIFTLIGYKVGCILKSLKHSNPRI
jgi:hypothetical protein